MRHFKTCKSHNYPTTQLEISQEYHDEKDATGENWKDENDLLGKTDNTATANDTLDLLTEDIFGNGLLASKFLSTLKEEWFSSYEFSTGTQISDIKYRHPGSIYNSSFYLFNNQ